MRSNQIKRAIIGSFLTSVRYLTTLEIPTEHSNLSRAVSRESRGRTRVELQDRKIFIRELIPRPPSRLPIPSSTSTDSPGTSDSSVNFDTLAQIRCEIFALKLAETGRSDVRLSQVDPKICRTSYCNIVGQQRIRYGRFSGLGD